MRRVRGVRGGAIAHRKSQQSEEQYKVCTNKHIICMQTSQPTPVTQGV